MGYHHIHVYKLLWFHIRRHFFDSLYVRVSDAGQYIKCTWKYCTYKLCHKLHQYILEFSTCHHTLLHTPTILHTKPFSRQPFNCAIKYCMRQNSHIIHYYIRAHFTCHCCWVNLVNEPPINTRCTQEGTCQTNIICHTHVFFTYIVWCKLTHLHGCCRHLWRIYTNSRPFCDMVAQIS